MKIDKINPKHWIFLIVSGFNVFASMPFRLLRSKNSKRVVFYYQLHGNSKALIDYLQRQDKSIELYYLAFPEYQKIYKGRHSLPTLNPLNFFDMIKVARSDVVVTNYGAQTLIYYAKYTDIKFVDVWHGLPMLKKQTPEIMNFLNYYTEVWVSSPKMKKFYEEAFQIKTPNIVPTGYGRVDGLINNSYSGVQNKYGLQKKKIILIAPTWKQNDPDRNILPFGLNEHELLPRLNTLAEQTNSFIIFRAHMLSGHGLSSKKMKNIRSMPVNKYPNTEELLSITDLLITDWSSLVFDYLPLHKPTIFIDVKPPFKDEEIAIRSDKKNRFGKIVKDFEDLEVAVKKYLLSPDSFNKEFAKQIRRTKDIAHGNYADGKATERYYLQLKQLLLGNPDLVSANGLEQGLQPEGMIEV